MIGKIARALLGEEAIAAGKAFRGYHGSGVDFPAERLIAGQAGRAEPGKVAVGLLDSDEAIQRYISGKPGVLPEIPKGYTSVEDFPLGRFRDDKIGTGEGAQAYSVGHYKAENPQVADAYFNALSKDVLQGGGEQFKLDRYEPGMRHALKELNIKRDSSYSPPKGTEVILTPAAFAKARDSLVARIDEMASIYEKRRKLNDLSDAAAIPRLETSLSDLGEALLHLEDWEKAGVNKLASSGKRYESAIHADKADFLDWREPIGGRLREKYFADMPPNVGGKTGESLYQEMVQGNYTYHRDKRKITDEFLRRGVPGMKFYDQGSRGGHGDTKNFVIYDPKIIEILRKYSIIPLVGAGAASDQD